jgi:hypothetical protein
MCWAFFSHFYYYQNPVVEKLCSLPLATPDRACSIASSNRNRSRSPLQHKYVGPRQVIFQTRPSLPNDLSFVVKDKERLRRGQAPPCTEQTEPLATAWRRGSRTAIHLLLHGGERGQAFDPE